jgi:nucleotide-binding universal stress UspA family protein
MSSLLLAALAAWLLVGAIGVGVLHHRGHDVFSWSILFVLLGPLAIPLAVSAERHLPLQPDWPSHRGAVDLLVAHDGTPETDAGVRAALALLDDRVTSVTFAAVVDAEAANTVRGQQTCREARTRIEAAAAALTNTTAAPVDTVVLFGEPSRVLPTFALEHGYELVVGSERIAKRSPVPVLVGAFA